MKTKTSHARLFGWSARIGAAALAIAFAASGFAQPAAGRSGNKTARSVHPTTNKKCYVMLSSSPFPQPCDRLGALLSTATPMDIIGEYPVMFRK